MNYLKFVIFPVEENWVGAMDLGVLTRKYYIPIDCTYCIFWIILELLITLWKSQYISHVVWIAIYLCLYWRVYSPFHWINEMFMQKINIFELCKIFKIFQHIRWRIWIEFCLISCLLVITVCSNCIGSMNYIKQVSSKLWSPKQIRGWN